MPYNIVHIICHDLGRMLDCYQDARIPSPNLDAFAREGLRFTRYFAASTPCSPSRGCIMTGRYAHTNGLIGLVNRGWDLDAGEATIVDHLDDAGYHTAHIGLQHERKNPAMNRYAYEWQDSVRAGPVAEHVKEYLEDIPKPFYLNIGFFEVHLAFDQPEYTPASPEEVAVPGYLLDTPRNRQELARFYGSIEYMDTAVGRILRAIDTAGLREDTIVLFTTDHGEAFPRAKSTLYDPGIATALLMRFPESYTGVHDALLSNIDLLPTLLEAARVPIPECVQGCSFLGLIRGEAYVPRDCVFSEKNFHDHYDPVRCVRTARHKYVRSYRDLPRIILPKDIKASVSAEILPPNANEPRDREELYDLETDPWEQDNRIGDPTYQAIRLELSERLDAWMTETHDPLLDTLELPYPPEQFDPDITPPYPSPPGWPL